MKQKEGFFKKIVNYDQFGLIIGLIVVVIAAIIINPNSIWPLNNLADTLANNSVYAILAIGIMMVLLTGGIDISIGAILAMSGVTVTEIHIAMPWLPIPVLVLIGILIGCLCGLLNGFLVGKLKMVPMIVTLGTMYIYRGVAYVISQGTWRFPHFFSDGFKNMAEYKIFGWLPSIVVWVISVYVIAGLFLAYFRPGRRLYAIGTSAESAHVAGIKESNVKVMAFVICGGCAGLAGVLYSSYYAMVNSDIGDGHEMIAIAICILGGVSISGGRGRIDGVIIAVLIYSIIDTMLTMIPGFSIWKRFLQGLIIIIAVIINLTSARISDKRALREKGARI